LAHGIGVRSDLPLPLWLFTNSAVAALVISFLLLGFLWKKPQLLKASNGWGQQAEFWSTASTYLAKAMIIVLRISGLVLFGVVLYAALFSPLGGGASIAPVVVFVIFWVGLQVLSGVLGNIWRFLSPWETIAAAAAWVKRKPHRQGEAKAASNESGWGVRGSGAGGSKTARSRLLRNTGPYNTGGWLAVLGVAAFLWLELAHPEPGDTRLLGWGILIYTVLIFWGGAWFGKAWVERNEGFGKLFRCIGGMGVCHRDKNSRVRLRFPLTGLSKLEMTPASTALVLLVLGSTTFDGISGTRWWGDLLRGQTGWERVPFSTLGLIGSVLAVTLGYLLAVGAAVWLTSQSNTAQQSAGGRSFVSQTLDLAVRFSHSLVPLLLAYSIAHYFSLLVFEGQDFVALISDPFGNGWDLFGTAHFTINYRLVSTETIAWVQSMSIVVGHISGVIVAHDRALELFSPKQALRSQVPLLMAMIGYTLVGLLILLNA